jgi:hypothetical protein
MMFYEHLWKRPNHFMVTCSIRFDDALTAFIERLGHMFRWFSERLVSCENLQTLR